MKQGRIAVLDEMDGQGFAALMVNGRLEDLRIDPKVSNRPRVEAIYRAKAGRPMKGQNGLILDLGNGQTGFLKQAKGISPGTMLTVQVATFAEAHKAPPVTTRLLFKSRYAILTPDAPGLNIARSITDEEERVRLMDLADLGLEGADASLGLILRTACEGVADDIILDDIAVMRGAYRDVVEGAGDTPKLLMPTPEAAVLAWRDWSDPSPDEVVDDQGSFEGMGVWDFIEQLKSPYVPLSEGASMMIEPTSAFVAVDVNTDGNFTLDAGGKANMAVARELPRQLRLRGLGGQIVIDCAPMPKNSRRTLEQALRKAFRLDGSDTILVGWTPLGHYEIQRKRDRQPLSELL